MLQDLLLEKLPRLMAHLAQYRVDLSFITFNWFLVVFADSLISNILLRVWDAFLYEGTKVGCCQGRAGQSWAQPASPLRLHSAPGEWARSAPLSGLLRTPHGNVAL